MAEIILQRPQAGQHIVRDAQSNDNINLDFVAGDATLSRDGDSLVFTFDDGASVSVANFYTAYSSENMPEFVIEGAAVPGEAFFSSLSEDLMPAAGDSAGTAPMGSGSSVGYDDASLLGGLDALGRRDSDNENNTPAPTAASEQNGPQPPVASFTNDQDSSTPTSENTNTPVPTPEEPSTSAPTPEVPSTPAPAPAPEDDPNYHTRADFLAADAGSTLTGNLLSNDELPAGSTIIDIATPEGWTKEVDAEGNMTFTHTNGTVFEIAPNGEYTLVTQFDNLGSADIVFNYTAQEPTGQTHTSNVTIGDDKGLIYEVGTLQGDSSIVHTRDENSMGNTYNQEFSDYTGAGQYNAHVNGVLMGAGDDTIYVDTAIGTQGNVDLADANGEDTFIYGDSLQNYEQSQVGNDNINVEHMDGTKIRADGNLYDGVRGGDDTINITHMEGGSAFGDGWALFSGSEGGDDVINVGTMNAGSIYGEGMSQDANSIGGDDTISVGTIDTTIAGNQKVIVDGDSGNDVISVGTINTASGDSVTLDGGTGNDVINVDNLNTASGSPVNIRGGEGFDTFNFNSNDDETLAFSNNNLYIAGENVNITSIESLGTGSGNDLIKIYDRDATDGFDFGHLTIDSGEGMDVILANASNKDDVEKMIENDQFTNTEFIVFSDALNNVGTTSTEDLFDKIEGVEQDSSGNLSFDSGWSQGADVGNYNSFSDDSGMTILVVKTQMENTNT